MVDQVGFSSLLVGLVHSRSTVSCSAVQMSVVEIDALQERVEERKEHRCLACFFRCVNLAALC